MKDSRNEMFGKKEMNEKTSKKTILVSHKTQNRAVKVYICCTAQDILKCS